MVKEKGVAVAAEEKPLAAPLVADEDIGLADANVEDGALGILGAALRKAVGSALGDPGAHAGEGGDRDHGEAAQVYHGKSDTVHLYGIDEFFPDFGDAGYRGAGSVIIDPPYFLD